MHNSSSCFAEHKLLLLGPSRGKHLAAEILSDIQMNREAVCLFVFASAGDRSDTRLPVKPRRTQRCRSNRSRRRSSICGWADGWKKKKEEINPGTVSHPRSLAPVLSSAPWLSRLRGRSSLPRLGAGGSEGQRSQESIGSDVGAPVRGESVRVRPSDVACPFP